MTIISCALPERRGHSGVYHRALNTESAEDIDRAERKRVLPVFHVRGVRFFIELKNELQTLSFQSLYVSGAGALNQARTTADLAALIALSVFVHIPNDLTGDNAPSFNGRV